MPARHQQAQLDHTHALRHKPLGPRASRHHRRVHRTGFQLRQARTAGKEGHVERDMRAAAPETAEIALGHHTATQRGAGHRNTQPGSPRRARQAAVAADAPDIVYSLEDLGGAMEHLRAAGGGAQTAPCRLEQHDVELVLHVMDGFRNGLRGNVQLLRSGAVGTRTRRSYETIKLLDARTHCNPLAQHTEYRG